MTNTLQQSDWQPLEYLGTLPPPSFGHTLSQISKTKVVLFGGATGDAGKYTMTDATYVYNVFKSSWTLLEGTFLALISKKRHWK